MLTLYGIVKLFLKEKNFVEIIIKNPKKGRTINSEKNFLSKTF